MQSAVYAIAILIAGLAVHYLFVPYLRLEAERRRSRAHTPQPQELWLQNGETLLYIHSVGPNGVTIFHFDGGKIIEWTDSWAEWEKRSHVHTLIFTKNKQPLVAG